MYKGSCLIQVLFYQQSTLCTYTLVCRTTPFCTCLPSFCFSAIFLKDIYGLGGEFPSAPFSLFSCEILNLIVSVCATCLISTFTHIFYLPLPLNFYCFLLVVYFYFTSWYSTLLSSLWDEGTSPRRSEVVFRHYRNSGLLSKAPTSQCFQCLASHNYSFPALIFDFNSVPMRSQNFITLLIQI